MCRCREIERGVGKIAPHDAAGVTRRRKLFSLPAPCVSHTNVLTEGRSFTCNQYVFVTHEPRLWHLSPCKWQRVLQGNMFCRFSSSRSVACLMTLQPRRRGEKRPIVWSFYLIMKKPMQQLDCSWCSALKWRRARVIYQKCVCGCGVTNLSFLPEARKSFGCRRH